MTSEGTHDRASSEAGLQDLVDDAAHLLPEQTPLQFFVHHNTLHAFQDLSFEEAVLRGAEVYGTEPYMTEAAFARHLESGRILHQDLDDVLSQDARSREAGRLPGGARRLAFRMERLRHLFEIPRGAALDWLLVEGDALRQWHATVDIGRRAHLLRQAELAHGPSSEAELTAQALRTLWERLARVAPEAAVLPVGPRRRDQLLAIEGVDTDQRVHPLLIRVCSAFLDQGIASWAMPDREHGFLASVRRLYGQRGGAPNPWWRGLAAEWRRQERAGWDAVRTAEWALAQMEIPRRDWPDVLKATLLSLRGWAGMMRQFELRPDRAPVEPRPARLIEYVAVQLVLDLFAARHVLESSGLSREGFGGLVSRIPVPDPRLDQELVYEAFVAAQALELDLSLLDDPDAARGWLAEVRSFDLLERRRLLHLAFERRHRVEVLDGLIAHCRMEAALPPQPRFKAVFCIDERECSTRRQLEEAFPDVETFGYAGFFGVAMAYQGLSDVRPRPLCPVNLVPKHVVRERALRPEEEEGYRAARRRRGSVAQSLPVGGSTLAPGGLLAPLLGLASVVPLIARCLFPRAAELMAHRFQHGHEGPPVSRLALERRDETLDEEGRRRGYSHAEMADVVEAMLRTIALTPCAGQLVLVVGHGSSSLNNPHEAAHDCGATGGGRGGPNARAFASMANRSAVRTLLRERGMDIPDGAWFVGSYHNTCDDSMHYFDVDLVPDGLAEELAHARRAMAAACTLDAHERCRRFRSASPALPLEDALAHAEAHATDLAQPRPEYGHATNAIAVVGRRSRTRGLFLDRRAFLVSYDPTRDPSGELLERLLLAVIPVGAGINLEYYFSFVDPVGYGCGTKLPHNIVGLIGVMDGHASDLRTGLPWQMVEIHEPVRLLTIVECRRELLEEILARNPGVAEFLNNGWIQLVCWTPDSDEMHVFQRGAFRPYAAENPHLPVVQRSAMFYAGHRGHLGLARVQAAFGEARAAGPEPSEPAEEGRADSANGAALHGVPVDNRRRGGRS